MICVRHTMRHGVDSSHRACKFGLSVAVPIVKYGRFGLPGGFLPGGGRSGLKYGIRQPYIRTYVTTYMCVPYVYVAGSRVSGRLGLLRADTHVFLHVDGDDESDGSDSRVQEHGSRAGKLRRPRRDGLRRQLIVSTDIIFNQSTLFQTNKQ